MSQTNSHAEAGGTAKPIGLLIAAVGVVYGDIGTSPLYTLKEVFQGGYGVEVTHDAILGVLSLIFWSLIWVVSFKYMAFVLRADNQGEGGIMALMALARRASAKHPKLQMMMVVFGLFGAALFYGDSMITPAVSVLSAMEGLELAFDGLDHWIVPMALIVLVGLFLIQRHGTARIGGLVSGAGCAGRIRHHAVAGGAEGGQSCMGAEFFHHSSGDRRCHSGRRGPCADRCRSAVCRHGALWSQADLARLVHPRIARAAAQLFRARRSGAGQS